MGRKTLHNVRDFFKFLKNKGKKVHYTCSAKFKGFYSRLF